MKPRVCFTERTPSLKPVDQFGAPPADSPALRRLISFGLVALSLWLMAQVLGQAWPTLFPAPAQVLKAEVKQATHPRLPVSPIEDTAPRAILIEKPAPRALAVLHPGDQFQVRLPDGRTLMATERGRVPTFSSLPLHPSLGDHYTVTEGGADQGVSWLWYTPSGWSYPAWIDP